MHAGNILLSLNTCTLFSLLLFNRNAWYSHSSFYIKGKLGQQDVGTVFQILCNYRSQWNQQEKYVELFPSLSCKLLMYNYFKKHWTCEYKILLFSHHCLLPLCSTEVSGSSPALPHYVLCSCLFRNYWHVNSLRTKKRGLYLVPVDSSFLGLNISLLLHAIVLASMIPRFLLCK